MTPFDFFLTPPGDLIYFAVVILASLMGWLIVMAWQRRVPDDVGAQRYKVASFAVAAVWLLMAGGTALAITLGLDMVLILPPLERAASLLTILLLTWAFLIADHQHWGRASVVVLAFLIAVTNLAYVITAGQWIGFAGRIDFNVTSFAVAWAFSPLLVLLVGLLLTLVYARLMRDPLLKLVVFVILAAANVASLVQMAQGTAVGDYNGASRLALVVGMLISLLVTYRAQARIANAQVRQPAHGVNAMSITQPLTPVMVETAPGPPPVRPVQSPIERESVQLLRALGLILEKATPENVPSQIVNAILDILRADVGALLRLQDANYADITAVYDRAMKRMMSGIALNLDQQPTLVNAIERRLQRPLFVDRNDEELSDLYARLDISQIGPVYYQPLIHDNEIVAVLMVALPYTKRELTSQEEEILKGVAVIAAGLLALSYMANDASLLAEERAIQAIVQGVSPNQLDKDSVLAARHEMQASLQLARDQIAELSRQVVTLKLELDRERSRLVTTLGETEEGLSVSQRIRAINVEQETLRAERDALALRLKEAEAALSGVTAPDDESMLGALVDALRRERADLVAERDRLQVQLAELRDTGWSPALAERMDDENVRLEAERAQLASRLADIQAQLQRYGIEASASGLGQLIAQLAEQRADLQARVIALEAERENLLAAKAMSPDHQSLEGRVLNLQNQMKNLAFDRDATLTQLEQARKERDDLKNRLETVKQHRARLLAQVAGFEIEVQELRETVERLRTVGEGQNGVQAADPAALQVLLDDLTRQRARLEHELVKTRQRVAELENELQDARAAAAIPVDGYPRQGYTPENADLMVSLVQELRTPLTSIYGNIDLMLSESFGIIGQMQRQILQKVAANVKRLTDMIEELIRVTALDMGKFTLSPVRVDVLDIIERIITDSTMQFRAKGLTVNLQLEPGLPQPVADPHAVEEVFGQLLTNAYLVSPPGTEVTITARHGEWALTPQSSPVMCVFVSVEDRGGGIAPEDEPRVFTRKYKAENPLIAGLGDTGVGLSIARILVEAHHGRLWIETREHVGSRFNFILPIDPVVEAEA